jgi:hypothetical protein
MDKNIVNEMIGELENADTTFQNCNDLAALYKVRDELGANKIEGEISDILPAYRQYIQVKMNYQNGKTDKDRVIKSINLVCKEIHDLVKTLYSCSDMPLERIQIQNMTECIRKELFYD